MPRLALLPPPDPPVWLDAVRAASAVHLTWTYSEATPLPPDPRLACMVERRSLGGAYWDPISGWLPRGVYSYDDTPPDLDAAWEYRLRVRDQYGQVSPVLPTRTLEST
jgi:hypothetical protein